MKNKRFFSLLLTLIIVLTTFLSTAKLTLSASYIGEGTEQSPYLIKTINDLYDINAIPSAHYKLANDLDLQNIKRAPIAGEFKGYFNGDGHTIKNLEIIGESKVGLFSSLSGATVKNITLDNITVTATGANSGILSGYTYNVILEEINIKNSKISSNNGSVGALTGSVNGTDNTISNNTVTDVNITGTTNTGGFIGLCTNATVNNNKLEKAVVNGTGDVSGFIGELNKCDIRDSYALQVNVTGTSSNVGGFIGYAYNINNIVNCYAMDGEVIANTSGGGFIGYAASSDIQKAYSNLNITTKGSKAGGLVGSGDKLTITDSYVENKVKGTTNIGGVVGYCLDSTITKTYATNTAIGTDAVGGLVGSGDKLTIVQSYAEKNLEGTTNVGGLIGSVSTVNTTSIEDSYSQCIIQCTNKTASIASGLVAGTIAVKLKNSYAATSMNAITKLGLAPSITTANAVNSYFDQEIETITTPASHARTTAEMKNELNYANWDFESVWIMEKNSYPKLNFKLTPPVATEEEDDGEEQSSGSGLKLFLGIEEEMQLSVHELPEEDEELLWSSSDDTIVSTDSDGLIKALKTGDAVILVTDEEGTKLDSIDVTVVKSIKNVRITIDLTTDKSCKLGLKDTTDSSAITWTAMDNDVATVNSKGKVTATGSGLTVVTASNSDGDIIGQVYIRVK